MEDVSSQWALLAVQGPEALDRLGVEVEPFTFREDDVLGRSLPRSPAPATRASAAASSAAPRTTPPRSGMQFSSGESSPAGSARATRFASRSATRSTGTTSRPTGRRSRPGSGWACALDKEFTGVEVLRRQKEEGPEEKLVAFVMEEKAIPRQGMHIAEGGEVTSGSLSRRC